MSRPRAPKTPLISHMAVVFFVCRPTARRRSWWCVVNPALVTDDSSRGYYYLALTGVPEFGLPLRLVDAVVGGHRFPSSLFFPAENQSFVRVSPVKGADFVGAHSLLNRFDVVGTAVSSKNGVWLRGLAGGFSWCWIQRTL